MRLPSDVVFLLRQFRNKGIELSVMYTVHDKIIPNNCLCRVFNSPWRLYVIHTAFVTTLLTVLNINKTIFFFFFKSHTL